MYVEYINEFLSNFVSIIDSEIPSLRYGKYWFDIRLFLLLARPVIYLLSETLFL